MNIAELRDRFAGQPAHIVGRGPSLLNVTPAHFGPGPVIALNHAILQVRALSLLNPILAMCKDGCADGSVPFDEREPCGACPSGEVDAPREPELFIASDDESPHCFADYPLRYSFDPVRDLGLPRANMSAPVAVRIAHLMGASELVMLGHDAYVNGDSRCVYPDGSLVPDEDNNHAFPGYVQAGEQSDALARAAGLPIRWVAA